MNNRKYRTMYSLLLWFRI